VNFDEANLSLLAIDRKKEMSGFVKMGLRGMPPSW
jgi:hypothetical protein